MWCWDNLNGHLAPELANFAAADLDGLVRIVQRKLKKIQCRPHLIDGCLAATGLRIGPSDKFVEHQVFTDNILSMSRISEKRS